MCGRFASSATPDEVVERFAVHEVTEDGRAACVPRYNIAPTDPVAAVVERLDGEESVTRKLVGLRWGLVPSWSRDAAGAARLINARAETVAEKPSFRKAFATRRCLVPADGYYEWRPETLDGRPVKQPYFLRPGGGGGLALAGIYEFWRGPDGWHSTLAIITTTASDEVGWVHDRMPMTVTDTDAWLDPVLEDPRSAHSLLVPLPGLEPVRVSRAVNQVGHDGPELVVPVPDGE